VASQRILILQGHPDASARHLGHALADAYAAGAEGAGHAVRRLDIATLDFPLLRTQADWQHGSTPPGLLRAQQDIAWASHLVLLYPLWLGDMPALVKGFLEQVARPGFAFKPSGEGNLFAHKGLTGRSARIVVTMGMPAALYRWYFRAHSLKSLERNILAFVGIAPVRATLVGSIEGLGEEGASQWVARMRQLGARAD
jgi:putative NADPH-quinone reductase